MPDQTPATFDLRHSVLMFLYDDKPTSHDAIGTTCSNSLSLVGWSDLQGLLFVS